MAGFLQNWFDDTASALAYAVGRQHAAPGFPQLDGPYNDLAEFVLGQQAQMPDYLRLPMRAATAAFDTFGLARGGGLFHRGEPGARRRQIEAWRDSRIAFKRDLVRYHESLATLALYNRAQTISGNASPQRTPPFAPEADSVLTRPGSELRCEIAVVGSGPGGAITACLLAEAGRDVLLIEEGPFHRLSSCEAFSSGEMLQKYRNGGQTVAFGKNKVTYVEGRCVGGGSEINSGLYHRTPPEILEIWRRDYQVEGLAEKDLLPHFEACERDVSVSPLPGKAPAASLKLHEGAVRLGWKSLEVPRWFRYGEGGGTRQSMTETFVPRFLHARGRLVPNTQVERLRRDGSRWQLMARHKKLGAICIEAGTVFLCAGAVQTPALLRRSGITRNIGNTLRVHPTVKLVARFPEPVNAADMGVPVHQVKEFSPRLSFGCSISTPAYLALGMIDHPAFAGTVRDEWQHMANFYSMITGQGRGTVRVLAGFRDPLVRYGITDSDRRDLSDGLRKLAQLLFESGATALYPGVTGLERFTRPGELSRIPNALPNGLANLMTIHLFCSCPMGEDRNLCATDSFGRVHGIEQLHIGDASLLCTAPGVNPQGTIMALARRNALNFLGQL
jgi:choline dehydrogenase-like flavoprotein